MKAVIVVLCGLVACIAASDGYTGSTNCPSRCHCYETRVTCYKLTSLPSVPSSTTELTIKDSDIPTLSSSAFSSLQNLQHLEISNSKVSTIRSGAFSGLQQLKTLNLRHNQLTSIYSTLIRDTPKLQTLDLRNNQIKTPQQSTFQSLTGLQDVLLQHNPIVCDCSLKWLYTGIARGWPITGFCGSPRLLESTSLGAVPHDHCGFLEFQKRPENITTTAGQTIVFTCIPKDLTHKVTWAMGGTVENEPLVSRHAREVRRERPKFTRVPVRGPGPFREKGDPGPIREKGDRRRKGYIREKGRTDLSIEQEEPTKDNYRPIQAGDRITLLDSGRGLQIEHVQKSDAGLYMCIISDGYKTRKSFAYLEVEEEPGRGDPTDFPSVVEAHSKQDLKLAVTLRRYRDLHARVFCLKDGKRLQLSRRIQVSVKQGLCIFNVSRFDAGEYKCITETVRGRAKRQFTIIVDGSRAPGNTLVDAAIRQASREVDQAVTRSIGDLLNDPPSPNRLLRMLRFPSGQARKEARTTEVIHRAIEIVKEQVKSKYGDRFGKDLFSHFTADILRRIPEDTGCEDEVPDCSECDRYRTATGECNNLQNPLWGASNRPFIRDIPPEYADAFNAPRGFPGVLYNGFALPSARAVTNAVITPEPMYKATTPVTAMLMQWGQFIDHDLDLAPASLTEHRYGSTDSCSDSCVVEDPCFPISIPSDDPRIEAPCMSFLRSAAHCGTGVHLVHEGATLVREQINAITSYIDANNVYGSTQEVADELREFTNGRLKEGIESGSSGKHLLPFNLGEEAECQLDPDHDNIPCFLAGDIRASEQLGLISMHTIWMRQHNKLAQQLRALNPLWTDETLYQEARKIVGAQLQHITYYSYLPRALGVEYISDLIGTYAGYDPTVNAQVTNSFATAAYRYGHSLVNPVLFRLDETMSTISEGNVNLHQSFFAPWRIVEEGGPDPVLRGLYGIPIRGFDAQGVLNEELTEKLFEVTSAFGLDLAALNIQRGRDHGLPSYAKFREYCQLSVPNTFNDLADDIPDPVIRNKLQDLYKHPHNIDVWAGGILEKPLPGARVGPTFRCMIASQFKRTRDGDRFWYEHEGVFTGDQLAQIRKTTLSRVICDNADDITQITPDAFVLHKYPEEYVDCSSLPELDLSPWQSCCYDCPTGERIVQPVPDDHDPWTIYPGYDDLSRWRRSVNQTEPGA